VLRLHVVGWRWLCPDGQDLAGGVKVCGGLPTLTGHHGSQAADGRNRPQDVQAMQPHHTSTAVGMQTAAEPAVPHGSTLHRRDNAGNPQRPLRLLPDRPRALRLPEQLVRLHALLRREAMALRREAKPGRATVPLL